MKKMKKRTASYRCAQIRATDDQSIVGRIPYNSPSEDIGFIEILKTGCFSNAIEKADNIMSLWNHDDSKPLGNTKAGTLILNDTPQGLNVRIMPNVRTSWGASALAAVKRGDIGGLSFGFSVKDSGIKWSKNNSVREIHEIDRLYEISPVSFPAYSESCVRLRSSRCQTGQSLYLRHMLRDMEKFFGVRRSYLSRKTREELKGLRDYFERKNLSSFFRRSDFRRYFQRR